MNNVLIITERSQEYYYTPFVDACKKRGWPVNIFLFFQSEYPHKRTFTINVNEDNKIGGSVDVYDPRLRRETRADLHEISLAWYLRAEMPDSSDRELSEMERIFLRNESIAALRSMYSCIECQWINTREAIKYVEQNKLYQQVVARSCKLSVPQTVISTSSADIIDHLADENDLLIKTLGFVDMTNDSDEPLFIYSNRISENVLRENANLIKNCPIFVQAYIPKRYEYRITVAGNHLASCRIHSQMSTKTATDWRHYDMRNVVHENVSLPDEVNKKILQFMEKINLKYGAIDLIETPLGEYVFIEVNPSGQWDWVNHYAELEIPEKVVDMLIDNVLSSNRP